MNGLTNFSSGSCSLSAAPTAFSSAPILFLLFVFYELVIVPKYFLIAIWGSTNKEYGAMKLTLYSFFGGALVFIGILAAYVDRRLARSACSWRNSTLAPQLQSWAFPGVVPRLRCARRHLAIAHLGADRPRRRADRRVRCCSPAS